MKPNLQSGFSKQCHTVFGFSPLATQLGDIESTVCDLSRGHSARAVIDTPRWCIGVCRHHFWCVDVNVTWTVVAGYPARSGVSRQDSEVVAEALRQTGESRGRGWDRRVTRQPTYQRSSLRLRPGHPLRPRPRDPLAVSVHPQPRVAVSRREPDQGGQEQGEERHATCRAGAQWRRATSIR